MQDQLMLMSATWGHAAGYCGAGMHSNVQLWSHKNLFRKQPGVAASLSQSCSRADQQALTHSELEGQRPWLSPILVLSSSLSVSVNLERSLRE